MTLVSKLLGKPYGGEPPVIASSGVTADIYEDWSTYTSTANFHTDPRNIYHPDTEDPALHPSLQILDTTVGFGVSDRSLRYDFAASSAQDLTIAAMPNWSGTKTEVWVEVIFKSSVPFTLDNPALSFGQAYKLLHIEINGAAGRFGCGFEGNINTRINSEGPADNDAAFYFYGTTGGSLLDGNWHTVRRHARLSGGTGFHETWVDGVYQGSKTATTAATNMWAVSLGRNLNEGPVQDQNIWWGRCKIWYGANDPGW